jgi:hypothetical protein
MRGTLRASLALGFCLFVAPSAGATPPGLHVDPESPGGKEYAIPLDQARNDAGGGSQYGGGSGSHLFGVGVSAAAGSGGSGSSGAGGSGSSGGSSSGGSASGGGKSDSGSSKADGGSGSAAGTRGRLSTLNVAAANPEAGPQAPLLVLGASAAVVFAGVLLGLMLRRRRAPGASA